VADIVVGVDGSESSQLAIQWAYDEAAIRGERLRLVCAYQTPAGWLGMGEALGSAVTATVSDDDLKAYSASTIDEALQAIDQHASVEIIVDPRPGHPADVLIAASADADLLVVGNRGHGDIGSVLLGSVGMHCVHHAICPVVVVPHAPKG